MKNPKFSISILLYIIAIVAALVSLTVHATNNGAVHHNGGNSNAKSQSQSAAISASRSSSQSASKSRSTSSALQNTVNANTTGPAISSSTTADSNNASQSVVIQREKNPVSTAYAASIQPTVRCAGVVSGGAQGSAFGFSLGGSTIDENCVLQEMAKTAYAFGDKATAEEILCDNDAYRHARQRTNRPCANVELTVEQSIQYAGSDPYVRRRLGLPLERD